MPVHCRAIPETSAERRRTAIRPGTRPGRLAVPAATRRTGAPASAGDHFPNATVRIQRTLHHHNVSAWHPRADKMTHSHKNRLLSIIKSHRTML